MTVKLSSLRLSAEIDVAQYVRAAAQKSGADEAMVASAKAVGQSLAEIDAAAKKVVPGVSSLSRSYIEGYSQAAKFESAIRSVGNALDRGMDPARAALQLDGVYRKFGQVADAVQLAKQGYVALAPVVQAINSHHSVTAEVAERAAAATRRLADAQAAQARYSAAFGIGAAPSKGAEASADAFLGSVGGTAGVAKARAQWIADQFLQGLNERLVSGAGKSARESAAAFTAYFDGLQAEIDRRAASIEQSAARAAQVQGRLQDVHRIGYGYDSTAGARASAAAFLDADAESVDRLTQTYDPLLKNEQRRNAALKETEALQARGSLVGRQYETVVANINKVHDDTRSALEGAFTAGSKWTNGMGLARHEMINLSRQIQDVGVSLGSGQSFFTVLIQQGTQIADIFAASRASVSGFISQAARGIAGFAMSGAGAVTGGVLAGAGAAVAGYQYAESQRDVERSLAGVGRQSGITTAQINRATAAYADAARISTATAREILASYAATGKIDAGVIFGSGALTKNFAAQFQVSVTDAAGQLATAFVDPTKGAQELNKQLGFLDARTLEYIRTAQAQGRIAEAQKTFADALGQSLAGAADRTSGLARAWNAVWNAASGAWDALGKAVAGQITLEERLARLIEARRAAEGRRSRAGSASALAEFDAGISDLQEQIRRQAQQRDRDARTARENAASTGALSVLDELNPFSSELRRLETMAAGLKKGLEEAGSALNPDQAKAVAEAYERIQKAIQSALPPAERQRQVNENTVQTIMARTLAERSAAEIARIQLDSAFKLKDTEEQRLVILGKINELQAQANREARDALKSSRDQAALVGLRPYQRREAESQFRYRDNLERFGGSISGVVSGSMANGMRAQRETVEQSQRSFTKEEFLAAVRLYESNNQNVYQRAVGPNGGYNPSTGTITGPSTASGYYQITNTTWREIAEAIGINLKQYPTAMSAPRDVQDRAASALYDQRGASPWAPYNANLRNWMSGYGGAGKGDAAAGSILEYDKLINSTEAYNTIIRTANDNLAAQQGQLRAQRDTLFMSNEEIAKAQKFQELYNQAIQEGGVSLANTLLPEIERTAAGYGRLAREQEGFQRVQESLKTIGDLGRSVISGMYSDLRNGASGAEMFRNALDKIASKLLDMALNDLFGKAFGNNSQGLFGSGGFIGSLIGAFGGGYNFNGSGSYSFGAGGYSGMGPFLQSAKGNVFGPSNLIPFARGGVFTNSIVNSPTLFPFAKGAGLMGEAGPEAIMPLRRNSAGELGVVAGASNQNSKPQMNVVVNNNHSGAQVETRQNNDGSFEIIIDQVEARMAARLARGQGAMSTATRAVGSGRQLRG